MSPTALAFGVLALSGATAKDLGFVLTAQAIPMVLLMPFGGVLADRVPRALVVSTTDMILGALVVAEGALLIMGTATVPLLAVINVGAGLLNALWLPAFPGLVPAVLGEGDLQRGNAVVGVASNAGMIVGSALAGAIVAAFGGGVGIVVDGVTFLVAGAIVSTFRHIAPPASQPQRTMFRDLRDGWRTFLSLRWLWVMVAAWAIGNAAFRGGLEVGGPVLMKEAFDGPRTWAVLQTIGAIGFVVGSAVATRLRPRRPLALYQLLACALPVYMVALAGPAPFLLLALAAFAFGVSLEAAFTIWTTTMQTHVPRDSLSRASAFDMFGSLAFGPVGLALAGTVIAAFGLRALFIGCTALTLVAIVVPVLVRDVRELPWIEPERPSA